MVIGELHRFIIDIGHLVLFVDILAKKALKPISENSINNWFMSTGIQLHNHFVELVFE
tara:strand:+ start:330 stop:503 length:174 start_codon:yes stop_codon:yes gene_type:complete